MVGPRAARLPVGSAPWIAEERSSALQITQSEVEEFSFSAKNEFDWLNEHMTEIFSENQINVTEIFKTPGKLRGKTPRTIRKANPAENRVPLSDIFSATPKGASNPFAISIPDRNNTPKVKIAADHQVSPPRTHIPTSPIKPVASPKPAASKQVVSVVDSGYHGSQSQDMDVDIAYFEEEPTQPFSSQERVDDRASFHVSPERPQHGSPARTSPDPTAENMPDDVSTQFFTAHVSAGTPQTHQNAVHESTTPAGSPNGRPLATSSAKSSPTKSSSPKHTPAVTEQPEVEPDAMDNALEEPSRSPSDGSSPIRPIVRKSSLNFASLPAREPITHKSIGNRISRTSHLDPTRTSYYNRPTGGKSLGHARKESTDDEDEDDDMDTDEEPAPQKSHAAAEADIALAHNKTYTQRLQDQISKLGQTQAKPSRPSKSTSDSAAAQQLSTVASNLQTQPQRKPLPSPKKPTTPGAFPEDDDEDDWIEPLGSPDNASGAFSPRPGMPKSYSTDVMEGLAGKETVGGNEFTMPKTRQRTSRSKSPEGPPVPLKTTGTPSHQKSASVPSLPQLNQADDDDDASSLKKAVTVSNPPLSTVFESGQPTTPKSPSRSFRDGPLKQVKNKLSSILKSSKGLLASSAAISAEGKSSLISPSTSRLGMHGGPSMESLRQIFTHDSQPLYPDLSRHATDNQTVTTAASPTRTSPVRTEGRRTRASIEREKAEEKRREKEAKEARRAAEQMEKLEKAREKEREKARVFSKEQDRVAALEKQVSAQREQENKTVPPTPSQPPKATRASPRKTKAQLEAEEKAAAAATAAAAAAAALEDQPTDDVEMVDAPNPMPPPSVPRSAAPASTTKPREIKRPLKPAKELAGKIKQAPTVIRVNMNSQNSQHHPSNGALSSSLHDTLASSSSQAPFKSKVNQTPLQGKPSLQSLKSSSSSTGRPKALEMAARRKEQEEREAQRKRDAKAEIERKRAAMQEEERRQEQQRREEERKQAEAKKNAQRQAMLEKAKQTRAPPPAVRAQPSGPPDYGRPQDQAQKGEARPPSRLAAAAPRSQEELGRPVNATLASTSKAPSKRPLQQDENADKAARQPPSRPGTTYQTKDSKRMRMTDEFDDDVPPVNKSSLKGAPIRPSGGYKKDVPNKPMFPVGYTNAPPSATRDLFKTTVTNQHASHIKATHPLDTAQFSKGAIPFAPNPNPAGPSHKTPARPPQGVAGVKSAAKSATRSSPRFQNGESIELPEINTDDEDDDDSDDGGGGSKDVMAAWADSPELRRALVEQESKDPFQIFGAPAPLNMEEVFAKSKERFHKFRARTSSANWSGHDRLTEEDIRKDLAARDRMRREGGWTYEMSKELA